MFNKFEGKNQRRRGRILLTTSVQTKISYKKQKGRISDLFYIIPPDS